MNVPDLMRSMCEKAGIIPAVGSTRMMKHPYTMTQTIGLFPWKFYYTNIWFYRYTFYAFFPTLYVMHWIGKKSRSPANYQRVADAAALEHKREQEKADLA